jgi:hypothetical protein
MKKQLIILPVFILFIWRFPFGTGVKPADSFNLAIDEPD